MSVFQHTLDPSGAVGGLGDWVCLKTDGTVTRAITSALTTYGAVYGCIVIGGNPGSTVSVLTEGAVPPSISGLAALSGKARVNGSTARAERVASISGADYPIGDIDTSGTVEFGNEPTSVNSRAQLEAITTPKHGSYVFVVDANVHFVFSATDATTPNGVSVLAADDGSRGRWTITTVVSSLTAGPGLVVTGSGALTVAHDPTYEYIIAPTATLAATLTALLAAGWRRFRLLGGAYGWEATSPLVIPHSNVSIVGAGKGRTVVTASTSPNISLADDRTNCFISFAGVVRTDIMSTTLTTTISPGGVAWFGEGARKLSVVSIGTMTAGQWFQVGGTDCTGRGNPAGQSGSNYQTGELLKAAVLTTSPDPRITLEWPTRQHHSRDVSGVGGTTPFVRAVDPVTDIEVRGITFVSTSHAVGLRFDLCARVTRDDLEFIGFTRSPVEVGLGCLMIDGDNEVYESSNGGFYARSLVLGRNRFRTSAKGSKAHPLGGYHRAAAFIEHACFGLDLSGTEIQNRVKAMDWRGVAGNCVADHVRISDIHFYAQTNPPPNSASRGSAIDTGSGEGPDDEHSFGLRMHDFVATACYHNPSSAGVVDINDYFDGAVSHHDTTECNLEGEVRAGLESATIDGDANYVVPGVASQDAGGRLKIRCVGTLYGFSLRSATQPVLLDGCEHYGAPGAGPVSVVSLVVKYGSGFEVRDFYGQGYTWFTSDYGGSVTPYALEVTGVYSMDGEKVHGPLRICTFSGAVANNGSVWAVDSTAASGTTKLKIPSANTEHFVIAHGRNNLSGWADGGFGLFGEVGQGKMLVSGAGNAGNTVDVSLGSTTAVATGGTAVGALTVARLLETKGAGTALVKVARLR